MVAHVDTINYDNDYSNKPNMNTILLGANGKAIGNGADSVHEGSRDNSPTTAIGGNTMISPRGTAKVEATQLVIPGIDKSPASPAPKVSLDGTYGKLAGRVQQLLDLWPDDPRVIDLSLRYLEWYHRKYNGSAVARRGGEKYLDGERLQAECEDLLILSRAEEDTPSDTHIPGTDSPRMGHLNPSNEETPISSPDGGILLPLITDDGIPSDGKIIEVELGDHSQDSVVDCQHVGEVASNPVISGDEVTSDCPTGLIGNSTPQSVNTTGTVNKLNSQPATTTNSSVDRHQPEDGVLLGGRNTPQTSVKGNNTGADGTKSGGSTMGNQGTFTVSMPIVKSIPTLDEAISRAKYDIARYHRDGRELPLQLASVAKLLPHSKEEEVGKALVYWANAWRTSKDGKGLDPNTNEILPKYVLYSKAWAPISMCIDKYTITKGQRAAKSLATGADAFLRGTEVGMGILGRLVEVVAAGTSNIVGTTLGTTVSTAINTVSVARSNVVRAHHINYLQNHQADPIADEYREAKWEAKVNRMVAKEVRKLRWTQAEDRVRSEVAKGMAADSVGGDSANPADSE